MLATGTMLYGKLLALVWLTFNVAVLQAGPVAVSPTRPLFQGLSQVTLAIAFSKKVRANLDVTAPKHLQFPGNYFNTTGAKGKN